MKLIFPCAFLVCLLLSACAESTASLEPVFLTTLKNETDRVTVENQEAMTVIDIQSPSGIGSLRLDLESGTLPEKILLRLHLAGLEEFRLSSEKISLLASISNGGGLTDTHQRIVSPGVETPITPNHPYWLNIRRVPDEMNPNMSPGGEYFEVELSKQILDELGNSFEVLWIDFYR